MDKTATIIFVGILYTLILITIYGIFLFGLICWFVLIIFLITCIFYIIYLILSGKKVRLHKLFSILAIICLIIVGVLEIRVRENDQRFQEGVAELEAFNRGIENYVEYNLNLNTIKSNFDTIMISDATPDYCIKVDLLKKRKNEIRNYQIFLIRKLEGIINLPVNMDVDDFSEENLTSYENFLFNVTNR